MVISFLRTFGLILLLYCVEEYQLLCVNPPIESKV
jgi:hypothetical protein